MRERIRAWGKRVMAIPILRVLVEEMSHKSRVVGDSPIDTIGAGIVNNLGRCVCTVLETPGTILQHAEYIHVAWGATALAANLEKMGIPCRRPLLSILVDSGEKEMVKEPDMGGDKRVEAVVDLKVHEKPLPLEAESVSDVVPKTLDARIVDTPEMLSVTERLLRGLLRTFPRCRSPSTLPAHLP
jgi:hypothetical protein